MLSADVGHPLGLKPGVDASAAMKLPYLRLASAITYKAIKDLRDESDELAISALLFLCLDEVPRWTLELLEFETDNPAILISRGLPDKLPGRQPGPIKNKEYGGTKCKG